MYRVAPACCGSGGSIAGLAGLSIKIANFFEKILGRGVSPEKKRMQEWLESQIGLTGGEEKRIIEL